MPSSRDLPKTENLRKQRLENIKARPAKKLNVPERAAIRGAIKRVKALSRGYEAPCPHCSQPIEYPGSKELEKKIEADKDYIKKMSLEYETEFDFPEGRIQWRGGENPTVKYDAKALDELIESGQIDSDTAAIIRKTRGETFTRSMWVL